MSTPTLSLHENALDIKQVSRVLDELEQRLASLDAGLDAGSSQRHKYQLLGTILASLDELEAVGAADLFWSRETTRDSPDDLLNRARARIAEFEAAAPDMASQRQQVQSAIDVETAKLRRLNYELISIEEEVENRREDFVVVRAPTEIPYRPLIMPWSRDGEDHRRYRKILSVCLLVSLSFGSAVLYFKPGQERKHEELIPDRIADLVVRKKEEPKPEPKPVEAQDKPRDKAPDKTTAANRTSEPRVPPAESPPSPAPAAPDTQQTARASAQTKGVLALKDEFAGLIDSAPAKVGAEGAVSNTRQIAAGAATSRSLIVSQVGGNSGGINVAAISRSGTGGGGGGGGGSGIGTGGGGVQIARVASGTGSAMAEARPLSSGAGPSRTDEEIQIVFDRYKAALYRIYNRELRKDPGLRGKMVLRLTIEPDGHVSACTVKSTDLDSQALSAEVVERVLKFNFGAIQGVPAITIVYPIDFLPAS